MCAQSCARPGIKCVRIDRDNSHKMFFVTDYLAPEKIRVSWVRKEFSRVNFLLRS